MKVEATILAAGLSTRMAGEHKLVRELSGKAVIRYAFELCQAVGLDNPMVVLGGRSDEVRAALPSDIKHKVIVNHKYDQGMASSVACAAQAFGLDEAKAMVVLIADMPLIQPHTLKTLVAALPGNDCASIIVPTFKGKRGNPVIWTQHFFSDLKKLEGDRGGRQLFDKHRENLIEVEVNDRGILFDIDKEDDFIQAELEFISKDRYIGV